MPLLLVLLVLFAVIILAVLMLPWSIWQRYRAGTARRLARGWVAMINSIGMVISAGVLLVTAALSSVWIPGSFTYAASGLAMGCALGLLGLRLTRWESTPRALHYTPNRWLVFSITLVVTLRLCFGVIRAWRVWRATPEGGSWVSEAGLAGSMGAGAVALGYYLIYWAGVWILAKKHRRETATTPSHHENDQGIPPSL